MGYRGGCWLCVDALHAAEAVVASVTRGGELEMYVGSTPFVTAASIAPPRKMRNGCWS
jgi:hypothetical protein